MKKRSTSSFSSRQAQASPQAERLKILSARKTKREISFVQEAWGDRSVRALEIPPGETAETYLEQLNAVRIYSSHGTYSIQDGEVLHEVFQSIGD